MREIRIKNNKGLLVEEKINPKDYIFGAETPVKFEVINDTANWTEFLPSYEPQRVKGLETMACVTFATLNCVEILYKQIMGEDMNYSDRFTAKMSGTTRKGNFMSRVAESVRTDGLIAEEHHPFNVYTWRTYYKEIPDKLKEKAELFNALFKFRWQWVWDNSPEMIARALTVSPMVVTVQTGSPVNNKGYYVNRGGAYNHAITLYNITADYYECYDHYALKFKKYDMSYKFGSLMNFLLKPSNSMNTNPLKLKNNTLVRVLSADEIMTSFYLDGKMIIDDREKIIDTWIGRNSGNGWFDRAPSTTITKEQWDQYQKVNLKGELTN